jgi:hypothetical protein
MFYVFWQHALVLLAQVTKSDEYPWSVLKPDVFAGIMDHYTSGAESLQAGRQAPTPTTLPDRIAALQSRRDSADMGAIQAIRSSQTPAAAPQTQPSRRMTVRWAPSLIATCGFWHLQYAVLAVEV